MIRTHNWNNCIRLSHCYISIVLRYIHFVYWYDLSISGAQQGAGNLNVSTQLLCRFVLLIFLANCVVFFFSFVWHVPNVACMSGLSILDCHLVSLSVIMVVRILWTGSKFDFYAQGFIPFSLQVRILSTPSALRVNNLICI